jgi:hypothetical protein
LENKALRAVLTNTVIFKLGLDDVFPLLALSQGFRVIEIQLRAKPALVPIKEKN